ncbi:MAG: hypothetical protein ABI874_10855 [Chloroflexota bacterium]
MPDLSEDGRMKGRKKGGDQTIEDAFKTMERFVLWLQTAQAQNVWPTLDPLQTAMLYRFLEHLTNDIEGLMALGGDDARNALELFQLMNDGKEASERVNE